MGKIKFKINYEDTVFFFRVYLNIFIENFYVNKELGLFLFYFYK